MDSAMSLLALIHGSSVGDLAALEEVVGYLVSDGGQMDASVLFATWRIAGRLDEDDCNEDNLMSSQAAIITGQMQNLTLDGRASSWHVFDTFPFLAMLLTISSPSSSGYFFNPAQGHGRSAATDTRPPSGYDLQCRLALLGGLDAQCSC